MIPEFSTSFDDLFTKQRADFDRWLRFQKRYTHITWDLFHYQQACWESNLIEYSHYLARVGCLMDEPKTLFRYTRREWKKPLNTIAAQYLTQLQLIGILNLDTLKYLQKQYGFKKH